MSTTALVTVQEYLARTEKPYAEYEDGVLYPKAIPTKLHSFLQYVLVGLLRKAGLDALHEVTVHISPTTFLIPDVVAAAQLQDPYPTEPVLLCIEILSPEDRVGAMLAKCEKYHAWGVPFCWVIDPEKRTAWQYANGGEPIRVERGGSLQVGDLTVNLTEVFAQLPANDK